MVLISDKQFIYITSSTSTDPIITCITTTTRPSGLTLPQTPSHSSPPSPPSLPLCHHAFMTATHPKHMSHCPAAIQGAARKVRGQTRRVWKQLPPHAFNSSTVNRTASPLKASDWPLFASTENNNAATWHCLHLVRFCMCFSVL